MSGPTALGRRIGGRAVRRQMPFGDLVAGFVVLVLGLALLCRIGDAALRFVLLLAWMAGAGVVLALNTNFSWPR